MRRRMMALVAGMMACRSGPSDTTNTTNASTAAPLTAAGGQANAPAHDNAVGPFYSVENLVALGFRAAPTGATGETLLCGPEATSRCVCLAPLGCSTGECITYSENVTAFRQALKQPGPGRTLRCDRAETGRCGDFRYFVFEGDMHRRELRWFDSTGVLVAQRNVADYQAYCGDQTRVRYEGQLPRCEAITESERICGERSAPSLNALDDLRRYTAPPG